MRFVLYTDKSVKQCLTAITGRMQDKATKSRPEMDGWVDKNGKFAVSISSPVVYRFQRRTRLSGQIKREKGITTIEGFVPNGASREKQAIIFGALLVITLMVIANGDALLGIFAVIFGLALYIPLTGDFNNSEVLYKDIKRVLSAKEKPPKK